MKTKSIVIMVFFLASVGLLKAQNETINLWPNKIPNAIANSDYKEIEVVKDGQLLSTSKVTVPTLSVFLPDENTSNETAIVVCPGGGYSHLAMDKEGFKVAKWLNSLGITAFVLKYRLPSDLIMENKTVGPLQDVQEAIRLVRRGAETWNINPEKVGVLGFSAGGHLASTLSTHYNDTVYAHDKTNARPDFSILMYPVISMDEKITHKGSRTSLLGDDPTKDLLEFYSNEKRIDAMAPPTFLVHSNDDRAVPVENSINYYLALKSNNVPTELHLYEKGGHGFGLGVNESSPHWTSQCEQWLRSNQFLD